MADADAIAVVRRATWFEPAPDEFGPLMDAIADAKPVYPTAL